MKEASNCTAKSLIGKNFGAPIAIWIIRKKYFECNSRLCALTKEQYLFTYGFNIRLLGGFTVGLEAVFWGFTYLTASKSGFSCFLNGEVIHLAAEKMHIPFHCLLKIFSNEQMIRTLVGEEFIWPPGCFQCICNHDGIL